MGTTTEPDGGTSLGHFHRSMQAPERRTFWACASGYALDGMDLMIYPLVIGAVMAQSRPATSPAWAHS